MRGSAVSIIVCLVAASAAACLERPIAPPTSTPTTGPRSPGATPNAPPEAVIRVANSGQGVTPPYFAGENITFSAAQSLDPDGTIVKYRWRLVGHPSLQPQDLEGTGPNWTVNLPTPGERLVFLYVDDNRGATGFDTLYMAVHERVVVIGTLVAAAGTPGVAGLTMHNASLPARPGLFAFTTNVTFASPQSATVRVDIRAANGTVMNRTESDESPAWGVHATSPSASGNYTTQAYLVAGLPTEVRLEFIAWYRTGAEQF